MDGPSWIGVGDAQPLGRGRHIGRATSVTSLAATVLIDLAKATCMVMGPR